ncbi:MAG: amino acid permease [Gemmatimonadales bacterium]|nr:amino acid permease [Gemmatimonadales bacterium]NIN12975.1 amino acid permease [Gemmatimonadales bacterium]NIN51052.1 amino acid permease [Gemmatimonadales bacterium]NIP08516.1 amino acid permease [Gemmatimonadales bacterium]NIR02234.1 amino acid permease [Gemmatimonadales bacterium]
MSTALVVGNMIGSGVFLLPASLAAFGGISLVGWLLTSTGAVLLASIFARLSRMVPQVGGPYAYTRRGFGDFAGFLVGWGYWISIWAGNAAIAIAFVGYLAVFWPALESSPVLAVGVALGAIWLLTWVNAAGIRKAGAVQLVTTILKLVPLVVIGTLGLVYIRLGNFTPFNVSSGSSFSAITASAALTLWAFLGLESATVPAEDVEHPNRTIPRATMLGTVLTAAVYILGSVAVMGVLPPAALADSTAPFADAASEMWGSWASYAVAAGAAISCFGALNGWILLQGQMPLAAARDRLFPAPFSRVSRRHTPVTGLVVSSVLITVLMAMNYTRGLVEQFTFIVLLATLASLLPYLLSSLAALLIGRQWSWRVHVVAVLAFLYSAWAIAGAGQEVVYWGSLLLMAGVPVYVWAKWRRPSQPGDSPVR